MNLWTKILIIGLLPLWISIAILLLGSLNHTQDYWNVAPWIVIAAIPVSIVTVLMVVVLAR